MFREAISGEEESSDANFSFNTMMVLAIATSIDALAGGVSLAVENANIFLAIALIGGVTFSFSYAGIYIGNKFGAKYKKGAEIFGGIVLILLGLKILLEHVI
jgi:putative Mn2+ efflux pump MntP